MPSAGVAGAVAAAMVGIWLRGEEFELLAVFIWLLAVVIVVVAADVVVDGGVEVRLLGSNGGGPISCWIIVRSMAASGLKSSVLSSADELGNTIAADDDDEDLRGDTIDPATSEEL